MREKAKAKYIAPIEEAELACRMYEAVNGIKRPLGFTAEEALVSIANPEIVVDLKKSARAAMNYWKECIDNANRSN